MLYLWGELKNTMFHDERGLAALAGAKGSKAVGMSGSGHYLFRHDQQARRASSVTTYIHTSVLYVHPYVATCSATTSRRRNASPSSRSSSRAEPRE